MINVIGLGYIGLPTAFIMASHPRDAQESGTVHLVGTDYDKIVNEVSTLLDDPVAYDKMSKAVNPYGDGHACERIVAALN